MVSSDDHLASTAGLAMLLRDGSAVDAAIAANAVLAVVAPHACGLGGDLLARVHDGAPEPHALVAVGRSGSGADADELRSEGAAAMPLNGDMRSVTVPGCVDGWLSLHARYGRLGLDEVLAPAVRYAHGGFPPSPELSSVSKAVQVVAGAEELGARSAGALVSGLVRRPALARILENLTTHGRRGFYEGDFGAALVDLGAGLLTEDDLEREHAEWMTPISTRAWGSQMWAPPPVSQAYVGLSAWWMADGLELPEDPASPRWAHLLSEAIRQSAYDRPDVLHEGADGDQLISPLRLGPRRDEISRDHISRVPHRPSHGSTTYLAAVDEDGLSVSLIQSNASVFGSHIVVPGTGVFLQNRGRGFSLEPGHPAEYGPGRRPPHTLAPSLLASDAGELLAVAGTRGADAQPQVVLQLLTRMVRHGASPGEAMRAGRWLLAARDQDAFSTWEAPDQCVMKVEAHAPPTWIDGLSSLGHEIVRATPRDATFGSAHVIRTEGGVMAAAADPRSSTAATVGF
jgi:gamma-glutamyltranspeptidase/glutathione hydrolase